MPLEVISEDDWLLLMLTIRLFQLMSLICHNAFTTLATKICLLFICFTVFPPLNLLIMHDEYKSTFLISRLSGFHQKHVRLAHEPRHSYAISGLAWLTCCQKTTWYSLFSCICKGKIPSKTPNEEKDKYFCTYIIFPESLSLPSWAQ